MRLGQNVSEQLNNLGIPQEVMVGRLARLDRSSLARLSRLNNGFTAVAGPAVRTNKFTRKVDDARVDIPKAWSNPTPSQSRRVRGSFAAPTYYIGQPLTQHESANNPFPALFDPGRRLGAMMAIRLQNDPIMRQAFERGSQLMYVDDGRTDGAVSVSAMTAAPHAATPGGSPQNMFDIFMAMDEAIMREAASIGLGVSGAADLIFGGNPDSGGYGSLAGAEGIIRRGMVTASSAEPEPTNDQSVDLMTFRLKRLMDKRQQAYDLYRSVFDKNNEAAKTSINNMRA